MEIDPHADDGADDTSRRLATRSPHG